MVLEDLDPPDVAAQRVYGLVPADFDELEHRGPMRGGAGEETGAEAVAREVRRVVTYPDDAYASAPKSRACFGSAEGSDPRKPP